MRKKGTHRQRRVAVARSRSPSLAARTIASNSGLTDAPSFFLPLHPSDKRIQATRIKAGVQPLADFESRCKELGVEIAFTEVEPVEGQWAPVDVKALQHVIAMLADDLKTAHLRQQFSTAQESWGRGQNAQIIATTGERLSLYG